MSTTREPTHLRRAVLAVTLTDQGELAELELAENGLVRPGVPPLSITWDELHLAAGDPADDLTEPALRRRIARWLRLRVLLHDLLDSPAVDDRAASVDSIVMRARPRALPLDHAVHPGAAWVRRRVLGGALEVGLGLRGLDDDGLPDPDAVGVVPTGVLVAAGVDVTRAGERADRYLADMADLATQRFEHDPSSVLRPLGDADVLTLLASRTYRTALVHDLGMRTAAVPARTRGWLDLSRLDPAFAVTAAQLTDPDERGFERPLLVTVDEVALALSGGDPVRQSLADPAPAEPLRPASRR